MQLQRTPLTLPSLTLMLTLDVDVAPLPFSCLYPLALVGRSVSPDLNFDYNSLCSSLHCPLRLFTRAALGPSQLSTIGPTLCPNPHGPSPSHSFFENILFSLLLSSLPTGVTLVCAHCIGNYMYYMCISRSSQALSFESRLSMSIQ